MQREPARQVVFFAIGFETTTPPTAVVIRHAARLGLKNFSVLCCHVLTPAAITAILDSPEVLRSRMPCPWMASSVRPM
jgi:hydrogenase expression/formation protein HypD